MNLFKKKYKRSEWFEGLLWAESLPRDYLNKYIVSGATRFTCEVNRGINEYFLYRQRILDMVDNK